MSDFFSFLRSNRSKIGLVDFYDLGEIYDADQRDALKNIFLDPDGLDQIYNLSRSGVIKEDIRTMGGLDKPVINSLSIASETLSGISFDISRHIRTDGDIGQPDKHSFNSKTYSDNIIVFHGGIAANNIEYDFLDENGERKTTTVPTSRESLFNSIKDTSGKVTLASYSSLFRIRRRSHLNELRLKESTLISKEVVVESPTDILKIPVYMRTTTQVNPSVKLLECYCTKNSPLILAVKIGTSATFSITREATSVGSSSFVFGYELKRKVNQAYEVIKSEVINSINTATVTRTINVVGTLGQNQDCLLYIYLDPSQVTELSLPGFGIKEDGGKDIGLVGFSSLKKLILRNNSLSTYPVWLKTLNEKLEYLDIRGNSYWNNGIVSVFDYQDMSGSGVSGISTAAPPSITATQVLGYSGYKSDGTQPASYTGEFKTISDSNSKLYKDARKDSYAGNTAITISDTEGFRTFSALKELLIGSSVPMINADLSLIFPSLENIQASTGGNSPRRMYGLLPKFKNNDQPITVNYTNQHELGGNINMMGDTPTWTDAINTAYTADSDDATAKQFIGRFRVKEFSAWHTDIRGGFLTGPDDVNNVAGRYHVDTQANVKTAWEGWLSNLQSASVGYYSNACFKVATGSNLEWKKMSYLMLNHAWAGNTSVIVNYNSQVTTSENADDVLTGTSWKEIHAWASGWGGKIFSIEGAPNISTINLGSNNWSGYGNRTDGFRYLLPANFVNSSDKFGLANLYIHGLYNAQSKKFILKPEEFKYLDNLNTFHVENTKIFGKFPTIYNTGAAASKIINEIQIAGCNFRDLFSLGSTNTKRVRNLYFYSQGSSVGGALMPNFTSSSNSVLTTVHGNGNLSSTYPSNWKDDTSLAGKPIESLFKGTPDSNVVTGVTWYRDSSTEGDGERLIANNSGNTILSSYLMVGDDILYSSEVVGKVTQIDLNNGYIYALGGSLSKIPDSGTNTLTFRRGGQDISGYFENHTALKNIYLDNNKCTGTIPKFTGCNKVVNLKLSNNLFTEYKSGTIGTACLLGTGGTVNLKKLWLNNNPLSKESIRKIIKNCYDFVTSAGNRNYNINIYLTSTYYDSTAKSYRNWTRSEIFDQSTSSTVPDPTDANPNQTKTITIPDPYADFFDQMGPGNTYPNMKINLF